MSKTNASVSRELKAVKNALSGAERCLDIARRERERIDEALNVSHVGGMEAERQVLENAREGREQLAALERVSALEPAEHLEAQEEVLSGAFATL